MPQTILSAFIEKILHNSLVIYSTVLNDKLNLYKFTVICYEQRI